MKKELILLFIALFLMSMTAITGVYAVEEKAKMVVKAKEFKDITGDGINDTIYLRGLPSSSKGSQYKKVYIDIKASNKKHYKIKMENGLNPEMQLVDLNHDGVLDLFASVHTNREEGDSTNYVYTLKDFILNNLSIPEPLEIDSCFENGYKAKIKIEKTGKTYKFDLKNRKKYYEKLGIFYKGKLNEPTELMVNTFSDVKPIRLLGEEAGIVATQTINGASTGDQIANVDSSWYLVDGKWKLVKVNVWIKKAEKK